MSLVIIKEFETESVNLSTRTELQHEIKKYAVDVTKDALLISHLKKGKTGRYAKSIYYFLQAYPMNTVSINVTGQRINFGDGQDLGISCTILFKSEENYIEVLKSS